jgi:hypothetical protein
MPATSVAIICRETKRSIVIFLSRLAVMKPSYGMVIT